MAPHALPSRRPSLSPLGAGLVGLGTVGALLLLARRAAASSSAPPDLLRPPRPEPRPTPAPTPAPPAPTPGPAPPPKPEQSPADLALHPSREYPDGAPFPARLTEFHPDAPPSKRKMEGGPRDMAKQPLITIEQHRADRAKYPYVSVASDTELHGKSVAYGTRIYFLGLPPELRGLVFRIVDTGGNFMAPAPGQKPTPKRNKQIREKGHEPFDIATADPGKTWHLSGTLTTAWIDRADTLPDPRRKRAPNA